MGQGLPRPQARRAQHPHRRERHMAWAKRQVRRNGQNLRGRFPRIARKNEKSPPQGTVGYLRTLRFEVRGGERKMVSRVRQVSGRRKKIGRSPPCRIRTLPIDVR